MNITKIWLLLALLIAGSNAHAHEVINPPKGDHRTFDERYANEIKKSKEMGEEYTQTFNKFVESFKNAIDVTELSVMANYGGPTPERAQIVILRPGADLFSHEAMAFYRLAMWLKSKHYFDMRDIRNAHRYQCSDCPSVMFGAVRNGKHEYFIYSSSENKEIETKFYEIEMVMRGVAADLEYRKKEKERLQEQVKRWRGEESKQKASNK